MQHTGIIGTILVVICTSAALGLDIKARTFLPSVRNVLLKVEQLSELDHSMLLSDEKFLSGFLNMTELDYTYRYFSQFHKEAEFDKLTRLQSLYSAIASTQEKTRDNLLGDQKAILDEAQIRKNLVNFVTGYSTARKALVNTETNNMHKLKGTDMGALVETLICPNLPGVMPYTEALIREARVEYLTQKDKNVNEYMDAEDVHQLIEQRAIYLGNTPVRGVDMKIFSVLASVEKGELDHFDIEEVRANFLKYLENQRYKFNCQELYTAFYTQ